MLGTFTAAYVCDTVNGLHSNVHTSENKLDPAADEAERL